MQKIPLDPIHCSLTGQNFHRKTIQLFYTDDTKRLINHVLHPCIPKGRNNTILKCQRKSHKKVTNLPDV